MAQVEVKRVAKPPIESVTLTLSENEAKRVWLALYKHSNDTVAANDSLLRGLSEALGAYGATARLDLKARIVKELSC